MGTASLIIVQASDGKVYTTMVNYDGYPEGVGATLVAALPTLEKAEAFVKKYDYATSVDHKNGVIVCDRPERRGTYPAPSAQQLEEAKSWVDYVYAFDTAIGRWRCEPTWSDEGGGDISINLY